LNEIITIAATPQGW